MNTKPSAPAPRNTRFGKQQGGFSLIELGLALAVIALIAGGVAKGREVFKSAKVQNMASQLQNMETAISTFESRYGALPGDLSTATTNLGAANGDGNGRIATATEAVGAFQQLSLANLLDGNYNGSTYSSGTCPVATCPSNPMGGRLEFLVSGAALGGNSFNALLSTGGQLSVKQLAEIDRKIDDGNASTGRFQALSGADTVCLNGLQWNEVSTASTCVGVLLIN
jgi:type II secretory pathway pseudopilin PulG